MMCTSSSSPSTETRLTVYRRLSIALRRGRATIGTSDRLFSFFEVIFYVKLVAGFQHRGSLCFDVSVDGLKFENDQGLEENLSSPEVSKNVKFQGKQTT